MKILFVDDERDVEPLFRQKFRKEIKSGEFEFTFAFSGYDALNLLGSDSPPKFIYVFSDINMPGMSGLDLLDTIKERFPMVQVSMISAYGDKENYTKAINSGAKGFFTKPVDFESLRTEIRELANDRLD